VNNLRVGRLMSLSDADYNYPCGFRSEHCRIVPVFITVDVYIFAGFTPTGWFYRPECPAAPNCH
jgi:hypothetical protein